MSQASRTQHQQLPAFVCKKPNVQFQPKLEQEPYAPLITIYLLRLAMGLKENLPDLAVHAFFEGKLGKLTGLVPTGKPPRRKIQVQDDKVPSTNRAGLYRRLSQHLNKALIDGVATEMPLFCNVSYLAEALHWQAVDQELLILNVLIGSCRVFRDYLEAYCPCNDQYSTIDYLHLMTTRPIEDIEQSLAKEGALGSVGWFDQPNAEWMVTLIYSPSVVYGLLERYDSPQTMLGLFCEPVKPLTDYACADFPTLIEHFDVVLPYLQAALATRQVGVNILLHGTVACRWTLARVMAAAVGADLHVVSEQSCLTIEDRHTTLTFTQHWLERGSSRPTLLVIDNADDLFEFDEDDDYFARKAMEKRLHQQLIDNPLPVIWIIDKPKKLSTRYLRRFSYAIEVDKMPESLRKRRIDKVVRGLEISEAWLRQLIHSDLTLAQIEKAANVARLSQTSVGPSPERIMEQVLNAQSRLLKQIPALSRFRPVTAYDLAFTNTHVDVGDVLAGLQRYPQGRFCFYGAPGTGKTAFARYLAEQLGLPILVKRASDVLDKWVGSSERNIAKMFEEARKQGAILLLDEADSLLSDRQNAERRFETSQINEMLTQMESFEGIFICTTNRMANMDQASLRRFDFKIEFDVLSSEQRWALFEQESQRLGIVLPDTAEDLQVLQHRIQSLTQLTPGDFAVLIRQARFSQTPLSWSRAVDVLQQECIAKGERFSKMGFVY